MLCVIVGILRRAILSEASVMSGVMYLQSVIGHAVCGIAGCYYADMLMRGRW